jgi:hypothetical protein
MKDSLTIAFLLEPLELSRHPVSGHAAGILDTRLGRLRLGIHQQQAARKVAGRDGICFQ